MTKDYPKVYPDPASDSHAGALLEATDYNRDGTLDGNDSMHVVNAAMAGNAVVALFKGAAFLVTGSGSMLSETIHSLADLANQSLLKIGLTRANLPSDATHPCVLVQLYPLFSLPPSRVVSYLNKHTNIPRIIQVWLRE